MPRTRLPLSLLLAMAALLAACTNPQVVQPSVTSVTVTPAGPLQLAPGATQQLEADVVVVGNADDAVTWTSSNTAVATVDANGLVTAVAFGDATISAVSEFDTSVADTVNVAVVVAEFAHCPVGTGWYVSASNGDATATGDSPSAPLAAIQPAVDAAAAGDTVCVAAGTYSLEVTDDGTEVTPALVTIDKPLTLSGPNAGVAADADRTAEANLVVSSTDGSAVRAVAVVSGDVSVDGFAITTETPLEDPAPGAMGIYGVWVSQTATDGVTVSNNHLVDINFPIWANRGTGAVPATGYAIENNLIEGPAAASDQGIMMQAAYGTVADNVIRDTRVGIQVQPYTQVGTGMVTGNDIEAFQVGLWFNGQADAAANWTFEDNTVVGIASPWGWPLYTAPDNNLWAGIRVEGFEEGTVSFVGNSVAIGTADPPAEGGAYLLRQRPATGGTGAIEGIGTTSELGDFFTLNAFPDFGPGGVTLDDLSEELGEIQLPAPAA